MRQIHRKPTERKGQDAAQRLVRRTNRSAKDERDWLLSVPTVWEDLQRGYEACRATSFVQYDGEKVGGGVPQVAHRVRKQSITVRRCFARGSREDTKLVQFRTKGLMDPGCISQHRCQHRQVLLFLSSICPSATVSSQARSRNLRRVGHKMTVSTLPRSNTVQSLALSARSLTFSKFEASA